MCHRERLVPVNAQKNCKFCAQSAHHDTGVTVYPFMEEDEIVNAAKKAKEAGAIRFSIVTSGCNTTPKRVRANLERLSLVFCCKEVG